MFVIKQREEEEEETDSESCNRDNGRLLSLRLSLMYRDIIRVDHPSGVYSSLNMSTKNQDYYEKQMIRGSEDERLVIVGAEHAMNLILA